MAMGNKFSNVDYGTAKDGFRGYAREGLQRARKSGQPSGKSESAQQRNLVMGYGNSARPEIKAAQTATNKQMQSRLQGMAANQKAAGAQRQAAARKAAMNSQLARLNSARAAAPAAARPASGASNTAYRPAPTAAAPRQSSGAGMGANRRV